MAAEVAAVGRSIVNGPVVPSLGRVARRRVRIVGELDLSCTLLPEVGVTIYALAPADGTAGITVKVTGESNFRFSDRAATSGAHFASTWLPVLTEVYFEAGVIPADHVMRVSGTRTTSFARVERSALLDDAIAEAARVLRFARSKDALADAGADASRLKTSTLTLVAPTDELAFEAVTCEVHDGWCLQEL